MQKIACLQQPSWCLKLQMFNFSSSETLGNAHHRKNKIRAAYFVDRLKHVPQTKHPQKLHQNEAKA